MGGGVALYISSDLHYKVRLDLLHSSDSFESIFIEVENHNNKNIIVGVIYRPPSASFNDFNLVLQDLQDRIAAENKKCLISGYLNFNLLNVDNHSQTQEFLYSMFAHSFIPLINKPTRVTSTSATLIDNIFCNILPPPNSGILVSDILDHFPIFTLFPFTSNTYSFPSGCFYNTSDANLRSFKSDLDSCDWSVVFNTDNPNVSFNNFMNIFV